MYNEEYLNLFEPVGIPVAECPQALFCYEVKIRRISFDCDLRTKNFSEESAQTGSSSPVDSEGVEFFGRK